MSELIGYDWTQIVTFSGYITALDYWKWDTGWTVPRPETFQGRWKSGENYGYEITEAEMRREIEIAMNPYQDVGDQIEAITALGDEMYANIEWEQPAYRQASLFLSETMPRLWRIGPPDKVRIVFWFRP